VAPPKLATIGTSLRTFSRLLCSDLAYVPATLRTDHALQRNRSAQPRAGLSRLAVLMCVTILSKVDSCRWSEGLAGRVRAQQAAGVWSIGTVLKRPP
jgi:hypothetical protein